MGHTRSINTISEFHKIRNLEKPLHPLISVVDYSKTSILPEYLGESWLLNFYSIGLKRNVGKLRYGQQHYDFDEGLMSFLSPGQLLSVLPLENPDLKPEGWILLIHPDFIWNTSLAQSVKQYDFFDYSVNEALFLSEKEEKQIESLLLSIRSELESNIDSFSKNIIISQIELLLSYSERFYQRQFITREKNNHEVLSQLEHLLNDYIAQDKLATQGLPTVKYIAEQLHLSPTYLSGLLKNTTGKSTQQHIQDKIILKAKEKLSSTTLTVSEIAFELGFEHSQSFSKLFKSKTNLSPLAFRATFN